MKKEKLSPKEALNAENQIKALQLELDHNAHTFISDDAPPELIKEFLDNIVEQEKAIDQAPKVPVSFILNDPEYPPVDMLNDAQIDKSVEEIEKLLIKNCIVFPRPEHLANRAWYHFLIEEFFKFRIPDYESETFMHFYHYGDFHRDGPDYVLAHAQDAVEDILDLSKPYEGIWLTDQCRSKEKMVPQKEVFLKVNSFKKKHKKIDPICFSPASFKKDEHNLFFMFDIIWDGFLKDGSKEHHEGMGICQMVWNGEDWLVQGVQIPGFEF